MKRLRFDVVREIIEPFAGNLNDGVSRDSFLIADVCYDRLVEGNVDVIPVNLGTVSEGAVMPVETDDGDGRDDDGGDHRSRSLRALTARSPASALRDSRQSFLVEPQASGVQMQ